MPLTTKCLISYTFAMEDAIQEYTFANSKCQNGIYFSISKLILETVWNLGGENNNDDVMQSMQDYNVRMCSVIKWSDNDVAIVVARNSDWMEDTKSNLWIFPLGIKIEDLAGQNSLAKV